MLTKITYLGDGNFQLNDQEMPIDEETVTSLAQAFGHLNEVDATAFVEKMKLEGFGSLETTANKGVIVDIYEVNYSAPANPEKETEALAGSLNEQRDFVFQQLFPGSETKDVIVDLRQNLEKHPPTEPASDRVPGHPHHAMQERWVRLLGKTPTSVALEVRGTRYEYSAGENDIQEFFRKLRFNQGRALAFLKRKAFAAETNNWRQALGQYGFESIEAPEPGVKMIVPGTRAWERAVKVIATSVPRDASREDIEAEAGTFMHTFYVDFGDNFDQLVTMVSDLLAMAANRNERPRPRL